MKYINLEVQTLQSPLFVTASIQQQGTWMRLYCLCASQETGGRIVDCRHWPEKQWLLAAQVDGEIVTKPSPLWKFEGNDLVLSYYSQAQEQAVKAKRQAAQKTNKGRYGNGLTDTEKGKEIEKKGKERISDTHSETLSEAEPKQDRF